MKLNRCQSHFFIQMKWNELTLVTFGLNFCTRWVIFCRESIRSTYTVISFFSYGFKGLVNFNMKYFKFEVLQVNNHISITINSIYRYNYEYYRYCERELAFISALLSKINNRGLKTLRLFECNFTIMRHFNYFSDVVME